MNTRKLAVAGTLAAIGIIALGTFGFAYAQTGGSDGDGGMRGTTPGAGPMGDHAAMAGHISMSQMSDMAGDCSGQQAQMHEAAAEALGITVADLESQIASGKTIADISADRGVALETVHEAMHEAGAAGHGHEMMHSETPGTN
jgi:hypothetical protein